MDLKCPVCENEKEFWVVYHAYSTSPLICGEIEHDDYPGHSDVEVLEDKWPHKIRCGNEECEHDDKPEKFGWDPGSPTVEKRCPECGYEGMFTAYWKGSGIYTFCNGYEHDTRDRDVESSDTEGFAAEYYCGRCEIETTGYAVSKEWARVHDTEEYKNILYGERDGHSIGYMDNSKSAMVKEAQARGWDPDHYDIIRLLAKRMSTEYKAFLHHTTLGEIEALLIDNDDILVTLAERYLNGNG